MIAFKDVCFSYRRNTPVLSNLSLQIEPGTVCGLLGRNGVGKSTMLYLTAGLLRPRSGQVLCNGYIPSERKVNFLNDIFIVPEEFDLPPITLDAYVRINSVFYPRFNADLMHSILEIFALQADINLGALSLGQKKKAFLSFALACNTSILLLDEPTNGLDITAKRMFRAAISAAMTDDKTIIISTHQVYDVENILDHVVIADNNRILLNQPMIGIQMKLRFDYTHDPEQAKRALFSIPQPGGFNVVEFLDNPERETEVNLETLFELTNSNPDLVNQLFVEKS
ncbi:MAG: ABC transporter ATP-binding protein [Bacteroidales bacterium]|nr:ABC transporter ATP-binding protein [Bacteroidales bacterium]